MGRELQVIGEQCEPEVNGNGDRAGGEGVKWEPLVCERVGWER